MTLNIRQYPKQLTVKLYSIFDLINILLVYCSEFYVLCISLVSLHVLAHIYLL